MFQTLQNSPHILARLLLVLTSLQLLLADSLLVLSMHSNQLSPMGLPMYHVWAMSIVSHMLMPMVNCVKVGVYLYVDKQPSELILTKYLIVWTK